MVKLKGIKHYEKFTFLEFYFGFFAKKDLLIKNLQKSKFQKIAFSNLLKKYGTLGVSFTNILWQQLFNYNLALLFFWC